MNVPRSFIHCGNVNRSSTSAVITLSSFLIHKESVKKGMKKLDIPRVNWNVFIIVLALPTTIKSYRKSTFLLVVLPLIAICSGTVASNVIPFYHLLNPGEEGALQQLC